MKYRTFIAFLSLLILSGCGIFTKKSNISDSTQLEGSGDSSISRNQAGSKKTTEIKGLTKSESGDYQDSINRGLSIYVKATESMSVKACNQIKQENLKVQCEDEIYYNLALSKNDSKFCNKLSYDELREDCKNSI